MNIINSTLRSISKRAEKLEGKYIIDSFVNAQGLWESISSKENSIIYGRRGTGKTHVLKYLAEKTNDGTDIALYIDLRSIGSNGGLYSDTSLSANERVKTLLVDVLQFIGTSLEEYLIENTDKNLDYTSFFEELHSFMSYTSRVEIKGTITKIENKTELTEINQEVNAILKLLEADLDLSMMEKIRNQLELKEVIERKGTENINLVYPEIYGSLKKIEKTIGNAHIWILLDEWSEIPLDLQPYLADMIKRIFFPLKKFIIKIAAIELRSEFAISNDKQTIGIEPSADASSHLSLDELLVFDNDEKRSKEFFSSLIHRHSLSIDPDNTDVHLNKFLKQAFTNQDAASEFARASEGVARDALSIISEAAFKANDKRISIPIIRKAAKDCFIRGKKSTIESKVNASDLLNWVVDEVIKDRVAKAFMVDASIKDELLDFLYDNRVIHVIKQNISSQRSEDKGKRFIAYSIDYGCYVDLINTTAEPKALFHSDGIEDDENSDGNVPKTDYRSIRRAILDLQEFYNSVTS